MTRKFLLPLVAGMSLLTGCQSDGFPAYETSRDTLSYLQQRHVPPVSVGAFTGGPRTPDATTNWACGLKLKGAEARAGTYHDYIRQAFIDELAAAGLYSAEADGIVITGAIDHVGLAPQLSPFEKRWTIGLTLSSSNGRQLRVENRIEFDSAAVVGPTVCRRVFEAFGPAVQELIEKAVASPDFGALLG